MNNSLDRTGRIDVSRLDGENYFESLLREAVRVERLSAGDLERLQYECLALLAERTERYNAGDSSSIRVEKAQQIMESNLFTVGVWLKACQSPDAAVDSLLEEPIGALYHKGRERIHTMVLAAKSFHQMLLGRLIDTGNDFYRLTAEDGVNGFFKLYDPDFAAQEIHITADYPLYIPIPRLKGIEFIRAYLNALYYENEFCRRFSAADIHRRLHAYEEGYEELLLNIYEQVLTAAVGCILAGGDAPLTLTEQEAASLQERLYATRSEEFLPLLQKAVDALIRRLGIENGTAAYMKSSVPLLAATVRSAAKRNMLDRVFFPG
jgi:hypothetical protein